MNFFFNSDGYAILFFLLAGFIPIYFIATPFFLPAINGKTLEKIEKSFEGQRKI